MKKNNLLKKSLSLILTLCLIAAIGLTLTSCGDDNESGENYIPAHSVASSTETESKSEYVPGDDYGISAQDVNKDNGNISFIFRVVDQYDCNTIYRIFTNEKTVGVALQELNMISGEESNYGLYVKTVNGITADYDTDQAYWAFYVNNEYATTGIDSTDIVKDAEYCLKYTKG